MTPRNVLIVGLPRSGTSLTAAAFARNGYYVGRIAKPHVRRGDDGNPFGYYEADDVVEHNVALLQAAGFPYHNTWKFAEIDEAAIERIRRMRPRASHRTFVRDYERHAPWVWKDQRLCFTLGFWWPLMDPDRTAVVLVRRDFAQVHRSFVCRGWCPPGRAERERLRGRLARHMREAEETLRRYAIPHVEVRYAEFLDEPGAVADRLSEVSGRRFAVASLNVRPELNHGAARGWLAARLRRSIDAGWLRSARRLRPWVPQVVIDTLLPERRLLSDHAPASAARAPAAPLPEGSSPPAHVLPPDRHIDQS